MAADYFRLDPTRMYETQKGVAKLTSKQFAFAIGNNQQVVEAVTGQKIRVMGWKLQTQGAAPGTISFKSASGGTALTPVLSIPTNAAGSFDTQELKDSGYYETNTGEGLYCDIATTAISGLIFYITYTP